MPFLLETPTPFIASKCYDDNAKFLYVGFFCHNAKQIAQTAAQTPKGIVHPKLKFHPFAEFNRWK